MCLSEDERQMSMKDLEKAFDIIRNNPNSDFEGEKDFSLIELAEKKLEISFPPTYKSFLKTFGCGDIEGLEFYGLINNEFEKSSIPDAIWLTLNERKSGLAGNFLIIYSTDEGVYYALDSNQKTIDNEYAVVAIHPNGEILKVANDFGEFLLTELNLHFND